MVGANLFECSPQVNRLLGLNKINDTNIDFICITLLIKLNSIFYKK